MIAPAADLRILERARLDDVISSYEFHRGIESPRAFIAREWRTLAICSGLFVGVLTVAIFAIDPAFFYPRILNDPMFYFLKARAFIQTGSLRVRLGVNEPPINYVAMPGLLRLPLLVLFRDFDDQLRAIQISNLIVVSVTAIMYAYFLSWILPVRMRWVTIPFAFGFFALNPFWIANVFNMLAEAPYAALTAGVVILLVRILCTEEPLRRKKGRIVAATLMFTIAFLVKFTAPLLLLYGGVLAAGRARSGGMARRTRRMGVGAAMVMVLALVYLNREVIAHKYVVEPRFFLVNADKPAMMMNLIASGIPSQIIPDFTLAYARQPVKLLLQPEFGTTPRDKIITAIGIALTTLMFMGIWRLRRRFGPEIVYFLPGLPIVAAIIPGTVRYLIPYEPFIWIFFVGGVAWLWRPAMALFRSRRAAVWSMIAASIVAAGLAGYVRFTRTVGTGSTMKMAVSFTKTRTYVDSVARTFRAERAFLERLPRDRTLLISDRQSSGRWTVISNLQYYVVDSKLPGILSQKDVYVLAECGTVDDCQDFEVWDYRVKRKILDMPQIALDPVFATGNRYARVRAYKLRLRT